MTSVTLTPPEKRKLEPSTIVTDDAMVMPSFWQWAAVRTLFSPIIAPPHTEVVGGTKTVKIRPTWKLINKKMNHEN